MKATENKSSTTTLQRKQEQTPFFKKEGQDGFFSTSTEKPAPFFKPISPFGGGAGGGIQPKLKIGQPNDKYEKEADSVADTVVQRLSENRSNTNMSPSGGGAGGGISAKRATNQIVQRNTPDNEEQLQKQEDKEEISLKEESIQRKPIFESNDDLSNFGGQTGGGLQTKSETPNTTTPALETQLNNSKGKGSSLPENTRNDMESAIGADFGGVNVHTDNNAVQMNQDLGAKAFTHGSDIYFNQGQYDTNSSGGQHLLAHELTHTVQQGAANTVQQKTEASQIQPRIQRSWLGDGIEWIKGKIASGLNWAAERTIPGYTLLNVVLGKNLITDKPVARTGVNLIEGFMDLLPIVGKILFNELKETESLNEAGAWVEQKMTEFGIDFNDISRRLTAMWEEMSIWNGVDGNKQIFKKYFGRDIGRILAFKNVVQQKVKELRFEAAFRLVGAHDLIASLKKAPAALKRAIDDPKAVLKSFMGALKNGFTNFKVNFVGHFKSALLGWLFGKAAEMGVQMPKQFNVAGLFGFVAQLLGVTYQQIRAMVVKRLGPKGEKVISYMETAVSFVADLITRGPIALWEKVKEALANFKTMLFSKIATLVSTEIIKSAVTKLVSMLNPAGAIVQLVLTVYRVVKFFIDWWNKIKDIATKVIGSITKVALGQFAGASAFIENAFAKGIQIAIGFLASIFGLGGIAAKVKNLIKAIATPVQTAVGKVIDWIVQKGRALFNKILGKKEKEQPDYSDPVKQEKVSAGLAAIDNEEEKYIVDGKITRENAEKVVKTVKQEHTVFTVLKVIDGGDTWNYDYAASPGKEVEGPGKGEETNEVLALYRGIHYFALYDDEAEKERVINNIVAEQDFSDAVYDILGKDRYDEDVTYEEKLSAARIIVMELMNKKESINVKTWWGKKKTVSSHFYVLLQRYVNTRAAFIEEINEERRKDSYKGLSFSSIPFISTTKTAKRAAKYALNKVAPKEDQIEKYKDFDSTTLVGKLFVYLLKVSDLETLKAEDIIAKGKEEKFFPHVRYSTADKEITFPGYIPRENRVASINAEAGDNADQLASEGEKAAKNSTTDKIIPWG